MEKLIILATFYTLIKADYFLSLSYQSLLAPNYRANLSSTINTFPNDTWALIYQAQPSGWLNNSIPNLPFLFNGLNGIEIKAIAAMSAMYEVNLLFNSSISTYYPRFTVGVNNSVYSRQSIQTNGNNITLSVNCTVNENISIFVWGDNDVELSAAIIKVQHNLISTAVLLTVYPGLASLVLATNISVASIANIALIQNNMQVLLSYRKNLTNLCLISFENAASYASTNPAHFANYANSTNFSLLSTFYSYNIVNDSSPFMPNSHIGKLVILVNNISVDCTVDVMLNLPSGLFFNDGYWNVFNAIVNQNGNYIQNYTNVYMNSLTYIYSYHMTYKVIQIKINGIHANPLWDYWAAHESLTINIDGFLCQFKYFAEYTPNSTAFNCWNSSTVYANSTLTMTMTNLYLRSEVPSKVYNFSSMSLPSQPFVFSFCYYYHSNATYYIKQQILRVSFNVTYLQTWANLTAHVFILINNGPPIPQENITLLTDATQNPNNILMFELNLTTQLTQTDIVKCWLSPGWIYQSQQGYNIQFQVPTNANANLIFVDHLFQKSQAWKFCLISLQITKYFTQGYGLLFFNYFIVNLISFQNIAFLYYFVDFKAAPNYYRHRISQVLQQLQNDGGYQLVINYVWKTNFTINDPSYKSYDLLQNFPLQTNYNRFYDYGYSTNFIDNSSQNLIAILIAIAKLLFLKFLTFLPYAALNNICNSILSLWAEILLFEFVMLAPSLLPLVSLRINSIYYFGHSYFNDKINFTFFLVFVNCCILASPFIFIIQNIKHKVYSYFCIIKTQKTNKIMDGTHNLHNKKRRRKKIFLKYNQNRIENYHKTHLQTDQQFPNKQLNCNNNNLQTHNRKAKLQVKKKQAFNNKLMLLQNMLLTIIPIFIGFNISFIFIIISLFMAFIRLITVIKNHSQIDWLQFLKQLSSKIVWIAFNIVYLLYWFIEILKLDYRNNINYQSLVNFCDIAQTYLFLIGCLIQVFFALIQLLSFLFQFLKKHAYKKQQLYDQENQVKSSNIRNTKFANCNENKKKKLYSHSNYTKFKISQIKEQSKAAKREKSDFQYQINLLKLNINKFIVLTAYLLY